MEGRPRCEVNQCDAAVGMEQGKIRPDGVLGGPADHRSRYHLPVAGLA